MRNKKVGMYLNLATRREDGEGGVKTPSAFYSLGMNDGFLLI